MVDGWVCHPNLTDGCGRRWWQNGNLTPACSSCGVLHVLHDTTRGTGRALALAWDGEVLPAGCLAALPGGTLVDRLDNMETLDWWLRGALMGWVPSDYTPELPGRLVFVGKQGREVSDG